MQFTVQQRPHRELQTAVHTGSSLMNILASVFGSSSLLFVQIKRPAWIAVEIVRVRPYKHTRPRTLCIPPDRSCYHAAIILPVALVVTIRVHLLLDRYSRGMTMPRGPALADAGPEATTDVTICSSRHFSKRTVPRIYSPPLTNHGPGRLLLLLVVSASLPIDANEYIPPTISPLSFFAFDSSSLSAELIDFGAWIDLGPRSDSQIDLGLSLSVDRWLIYYCTNILCDSKYCVTV